MAFTEPYKEIPCDKCSSEILPSEPRYSITMKEINTNGKVTVDVLCETCYLDLVDWMNNYGGYPKRENHPG